MTVAVLMDFEPWRDLTPEQWQAAGAPRPRKPPEQQQLPADLPIPPLGVQRVDWARSGQYDERLPREFAPWVLPVSVNGVQAPLSPGMVALAKKREYLPADWADERDDRTAISGVFTVTFRAIPSLIPPGPLVFMARLNRAAEVRVDGTPCEVRLLGVHARTPPQHERPRRGWHTYALNVPLELRPSGQATFSVDLAGARCSQLLLCVTSTDLDAIGEV